MWHLGGQAGSLPGSLHGGPPLVLSLTPYALKLGSYCWGHVLEISQKDWVGVGGSEGREWEGVRERGE